MNFINREGDHDIHDKSSTRERKESATRRNTFNIDEGRSMSPEVDEDDIGAHNRGENTSQRRGDDCR